MCAVLSCSSSPIIPGNNAVRKVFPYLIWLMFHGLSYLLKNDECLYIWHIQSQGLQTGKTSHFVLYRKQLPMHLRNRLKHSQLQQP